MKILLINPPYDRLIGFKSEWFPLGLCSLASFLADKGHGDIAVYDAEHATEQTVKYSSIVKYAENFQNYQEAIGDQDHPVWKEVRKTIEDFRPDLVGIGIMTVKIPSALQVVKICKEIDPNIKIVVGGHHPTIAPGEMLENEGIDFAVRGEGEVTFFELLEVLKTKELVYSSIKGLSFKKDEKIVHNQVRPLIQNLDKIPMPARSRLLNIDSYSQTQLSMVMTSRGCPYECGFCASACMWHKKVRFRSIQSIIDELQLLKNKFSVKHITFMDDSFILHHNRLKQLCQTMIDNKINLTWSCLTRVNMISDEIIALMKKAGCIKVDVGIESGNERILQLINKKITLEQIRKAVKILRKNKMYWSGFFMFGFPTETKEEVLDTLYLLKELKPDWANISIFTPYLGTDLYEQAKERRMLSEQANCIINSHQNYKSRFTDTMSEETFSKLATHILKEVHSYNSSFRSLLKRALTRNYFRNPGLLLGDIVKVGQWLRK